MPRDPARGQAVSASGRDLYDERLEANRERFAKQAGELARAEAKEHGWRSLAYGEKHEAPVMIVRRRGALPVVLGAVIEVAEIARAATVDVIEEEGGWRVGWNFAGERHERLFYR